MSEWWTYRLSDLLMFSAATYYRLFALVNEDVWPLQLVAAVIGLLLLAGVLCGKPGPRTAACLLGLCWAWVGWAYHARRYADIHLAGEYFATAFLFEALLLGIAGWRGRFVPPAPEGGVRAGLVLLLGGLLVYPLLAPLAGRPWGQAELFGIAPDPTAVVTLGVLLAGRGRWWLWPIPLLWCVASSMTLVEMDAGQAWAPLLPVLMALGVLGGRAYRRMKVRPAAEVRK